MEDCLKCEFGRPKKESEGYYCGGTGSRAERVHGVGTIMHYSQQHNCRDYYQPRKEVPTKMDKQTAIINHRHMWDWLSENPMASKRNYMIAHNIKPRPKADCFLCGWMVEQEEFDCKKCILVWPHNDEACDEGSELWGRWDHETNPTHRAELARQIRDLPERGERRFQFEVDVRTIENTAAGIKMEAKEPPPPPKLTRAEAITKTREQWLWLARHPELGKSDYFKEKAIKDEPNYGCYLCQWTSENTDADIPSPDCGEECPLTWPGGWCESQDGLHEMWCRTMYKKDFELGTAIAYLIARLPEA